ncbi:MAG: hypothetical protein M0R17_05565 [Candidatus Omnitrophica bacterium]|jgi:hypothetical protein|nr:hypothetical protein [Candidatus Omnitrophota bacterium]
MKEKITFKQIIGIGLMFLVISFMIYFLYFNNDVKSIKYYFMDNYSILIGFCLFSFFVIGFGVVFYTIGEIIRITFVGRSKKELEIIKVKKEINKKYIR